jgi:hypothetical protein
VWTNSTTTPLERPADLADKAVLTEEERRVRDADVTSRVSFDRAGSLPGVGAYNEFWMERGALNYRTSLVIDPSDGKIPAMTADGQARASALAPARTANPAIRTKRSRYDRRISRVSRERCCQASQPQLPDRPDPRPRRHSGRNDP